MKKFPEGVLGAITLALAYDLHERYKFSDPSDFSDTDLTPDVVRAVKWVHAEDPDAADSIVRLAFQFASGLPRPVPLAASGACLAFSLTYDSSPYGAWSQDQSRGFVDRCLNGL